MLSKVQDGLKEKINNESSTNKKKPGKKKIKLNI